MLSFYLYQAKAIFKHISVGLSSAQYTALFWTSNTVFFTTRDLGIVPRQQNIDLPYLFEFCRSNHFFERSTYTNVFKFNREIERFERGKLNSRCFHWFPAAMLESLRRVPTWRLLSILNTIIFSDAFCRIIRFRNIAHPRNLGTLFIYYSSTIFQFLESIY